MQSYFVLYLQQATEHHHLRSLRAAVLLVAIVSTVIAVQVPSLAVLWIFIIDLLGMVLFPQLACVLYVPVTNAYGSLSGFALSLALRLLAGEPLLGLNSILKFPFFDKEDFYQRFPFKTFISTVSLICIVAVSFVMKIVFQREWLPKRFDIFWCLGENAENFAEALDEMAKPEEVEMADCITDDYMFQNQ
jgi:high affinity choline transporter 7